MLIVSAHCCNPHMLACWAACNLCLLRESMPLDTQLCDLCRTSMM